MRVETGREADRQEDRQTKRETKGVLQSNTTTYLHTQTLIYTSIHIDRKTVRQADIKNDKEKNI